MRFEYSNHAKTALAERRIYEGWIERVILRPEQEAPDDQKKGRVRAFGQIAEFGGRWLRVTYEREGATVRVASVFFDRTRRRS